MYKFFNNLTGGQIIYKKLLEHKVKDVFLYSGGAIMPLVDAFYKGEINYYINTHEQSGGHAATGYAKSSDRPGISIITSGPGLTNSVTALTDATNDSVPLIVFSGQVSLGAIGTNAFQECPSVDITRPVTKWSYCVQDVHELPDVVDEAFNVAMNGKRGGVHIDLPKCVTMAKFNEKNKIDMKFNNERMYGRQISYEQILQICNIINGAKKPIILAGQGCNDYSELLTEFVLKSNIPITTTIHGMGSFNEERLQSLEFLGMHGSVTANQAIQQADLIIALGTRFDDRITGNIKKYASVAYKNYEKGEGGIIHVNINSNEIESVIKTHYNYQTDCGYFLMSILPYINKGSNGIKLERNKWNQYLNKNKRLHPFKYNKLENKINTQQVIHQINNYLTNNYISNYCITTGVGNHQMMAAQFIKWKYPKSFISSGSLGVMGVGLPYAIGCQIANPSKLIIDIDGDGSFNHTLSELRTISQYNLPIKIAVLNDGSLSMVRAWEQLFFDKRYTATNLSNNPDYCKLAESFGIKSIKCDMNKNLNKIINEFLSYDGPILCEFIVEPDLCLPLVSPGAALDDMIMFGDKIILDSDIEPPS